MILPSKELLSAVLGKDIVNMKMSEGSPSVLLYNYQYKFGMDSHMQGASGKVNIYELMHIMKEWALKEGYELSSHITKHSVKSWCYVYKSGSDSFEDNVYETRSNTEPEAVTKACEWILEQTK